MSDSTRLVACRACGGLYPDQQGPTHRYLESSAGCAAACGELFAGHYSNMEYFADVYRLANDAYAVQHPGKPSPQTIGSAGVHLIRLCLTFEHGLRPDQANAAVLDAGRRKREFFWLAPPASPKWITVADFRGVGWGEDHKKLIRGWALSVWEAWEEHHATIRSWLPARWAARTA